MSGVLRNDFLSRDMNWWNLDRQRGKESVLEGQRASAKAERGVAMVWWESRVITTLGHDAGGCSKVR